MSSSLLAHHRKLRTNRNQSIIASQSNIVSYREALTLCFPFFIWGLPPWCGCLGLRLKLLGMQSGTPRHARIFDKMDIINVLTNTYSRSIKAVDTRYRNTIYSTGIPLRKISIQTYVWAHM